MYRCSTTETDRVRQSGLQSVILTELFCIRCAPQYTRNCRAKLWLTIPFPAVISPLNHGLKTSLPDLIQAIFDRWTHNWYKPRLSKGPSIKMKPSRTNEMSNSSSYGIAVWSWIGKRLFLKSSAEHIGMLVCFLTTHWGYSNLSDLEEPDRMHVYGTWLCAIITRKMSNGNYNTCLMVEIWIYAFLAWDLNCFCKQRCISTVINQFLYSQKRTSKWI